MNNQQKQLLPRGISVILVAVFLCISLIAFSSMGKSAAWFSQNDTVSGENMSVTILNNKDDITATVTSYAVESISSGGIYKASTVQKFDIPKNDPEEILPSIYKQALVVIVDIVSVKDTTISLSLTTPVDSISFTQENSFSNCMKITPAIFNSTDRIATLSTTQGSQSFVSLTPTVSKVTSINLTNENISLKKNVNTILCYVIEYDLAILDHMRSQSLAGNNEMVESVYFKNDIAFVVSEIQ